MPSERGESAVATGDKSLSVDRLRIRKSCCRLIFRGTVGAPFLANIAPKNLFIINKITEKGAHGAMFFLFSAYVDT